MVAPVAGTTFPNRILVTATAPGSSAIALGTTTSVLGYKTFSSLSNGQTVDYFIEGIDGNGALTGTWEVGTGTYNSGPNTFSRTNVIETHVGTTAFNFTTDVRIGVGPSTNLFSKFDAITTQRLSYGYVGPVTTGIGTNRWYPQREVTLKSVYCGINTPSTNNTIEFIIKKNGTSLGTTFSLSPNIYKSTPTNINTVLNTTDYLSIDIITGGGSDLVIYIDYV